MAVRYVNKTIVQGWKESAYATSPASYATADFEGMIAMSDTPIVEQISGQNKTAYAFEMTSQFIKGRQHYELTMSGDLTAELLDGFIEAFTGDSSSPHTMVSDQSCDSYEILRLYPAAGDGVYDVADVFTGCVMQSFSFSGEFDGLYTF